MEQPEDSQNPLLGPLGTLILGLRVVASELSWMRRKLFRSFEVRQLRKRMDHERGRAARGGEDAALAEDQADFLEGEIALLEKDLTHRREQFVRQRRRRLSI